MLPLLSTSSTTTTTYVSPFLDSSAALSPSLHPRRRAAMAYPPSHAAGVVLSKPGRHNFCSKDGLPSQRDITPPRPRNLARSALSLTDSETRKHLTLTYPPPNPDFLTKIRRGHMDDKKEHHEPLQHQVNYVTNSSSPNPDSRHSITPRHTVNPTPALTVRSPDSPPSINSPPPVDFHAASQRNSFAFKSAADRHCDNIKAKLDGPRRPLTRSPPRPLHNSLSANNDRPDSQLPPSATLHLQLPLHTTNRSDGSLPDSREPPAAFSFTLSSQSDYLSSPTHSRRPSYQNDELRHLPMRDSGPLMQPLPIDQQSSAAGYKRRAPSPPDEYTAAAHASAALGLADAIRRRDGALARASPTPRLAAIPQGTSISPTSTAPVSRRSSHLSTLTIPSSQSSIAAYTHRSPADLSSNGPSPTLASPFAAVVPPHPSTYSRASSGNSPHSTVELGKPSSVNLQDFYMCDCCPKKPRKFSTLEELAAHEAEKQYECHFCGNRFKNKNEAERHQNSLHVRRHSWSCSALSGYDRAFHDSASRPGLFDACGYCGDEFPRSGTQPTSATSTGGALPNHVTDHDWAERIRHLQEVHKFRECNASKKFYRADHFRQHLKHSHAGTSGKWTNMLENACLIDEDPAQPRQRP